MLDVNLGGDLEDSAGDTQAYWLLAIRTAELGRVSRNMTIQTVIGGFETTTVGKGIYIIEA